jgi:hypothetical protein
MNSIAGCRETESLCRQRAGSDRVRCWKWLGEAGRWNNLAHREIAPRFQSAPMRMGSNTIGNDARPASPSGRSRRLL